MWFLLQRRALFRSLSFSELEAFWLRNGLRATAAYNFWSLIGPDGSAPAALASLLFDPAEPQILERHSVSRLFYTFSRMLIFFLLALSLSRSSLPLSPDFSLLSLFSPLYLSSSVHKSEVWLLNFLRQLRIYLMIFHHPERFGTVKSVIIMYHSSKPLFLLDLPNNDDSQFGCAVAISCRNRLLRFLFLLPKVLFCSVVWSSQEWLRTCSSCESISAYNIFILYYIYYIYYMFQFSHI